MTTVWLIVRGLREDGRDEREGAGMHGVRRRVAAALNRLAEPVIANASLMRRFGVHVCEVRYIGRRSGRPVRLTAWWHPEPSGGRIDVATPGNKTWWRNFRDGAPIEVTVDGVTRTGVARAVEEPSGKVHVDVAFEA